MATGSRAQRLRFDGTRCVGIDFLRDGHSVTAYADAEVILSAGAGAVDSPRLLLLSGVGPAAELEAAGVVVRHDLPGVGHRAVRAVRGP